MESELGADGGPQYMKSHRRWSSAFPSHLHEQIAILRRFSGMDLVLLALDMQGAILCQSLAPVQRTETFDPSLAKADQQEEHFASNVSWHHLNHGPVQEVAAHLKLGRSTEGHVVLQDVASAAVKWWEEIMHGNGIGLGVGIARRFGERGQGSFGGGLDYGENAVMIAILVRNTDRYRLLPPLICLLQKLMTLASLHAEQVDEAHIARLRYLLNDTTSSIHTGVLEMTLACLGIFVLK